MKPFLTELQEIDNELYAWACSLIGQGKTLEQIKAAIKDAMAVVNRHPN